MLITNTSRALQGVHSTAGLVFIEAGKSQEVDVAPDYLDRLKSLPFLTIGGKPADTDEPAGAKIVDGRDANGDTPEMAQLRGMFDASWERARQQAGATEGESLDNVIQRLVESHEATNTFETNLREALGLKDGEGIIEGIAALKDKIAELELENEDLTKRIPAAVIPEAKHRGAGSYSIMEGDTELREKLTKDQAEAFNALDAEGRAKWLADNPKAAA